MVTHPRLMPHRGIIWVHITLILGMKIIVPLRYKSGKHGKNLYNQLLALHILNSIV